MKKFSAAVLAGLLLLISTGCSSTPSGTVAVKDLQQNIEQQVGQKVVVVGKTDTRTAGMSAVKLFKVYKGTDSVWASVPEGEVEPPHGVEVRVTGVVQSKEFPGGIGQRFFIDSETVNME